MSEADARVSDLMPMTLRFTAAARHLEEKHLEKCLGCGRKFAEDDTTHLGYAGNGRCILVGDCCSGKLSETAIRHRFAPRPFYSPSSERKLWRYMNFAKYAEMLRTGSLYFSRLDRLGDPFEGAMGASAGEERWCRFYLSSFKRAIRNPPAGYRCQLSTEEIEKEARRLLEEFRNANAQTSRRTYVNCWHRAEHESDAMWRLYSSGSEYAVAIQTSAGRLSRVTDRPITVGSVRYIDYLRHYPDVNFPHFFKRLAFQHEQEVRAVVTSPSASAPAEGIPVAVDLEQLVERICVSPLAPSWFLALVQDVTDRYALSRAAQGSSLADAPFM